MSIGAVSSSMAAIPPMRTPEGKEGHGPDHDGDADDKGIGASTGAVTRAAVPQGMGAAVNTQA